MSNIGIFIYGTKNGLKPIFSTPNLSNNDKELIEVRAGASDESVVGENCYSISFTTNGKIFTKYKIIRDGQRSMEVGFLAISLFVPFDEKAGGNVIISILEKLMDGYCQYAPDNLLGSIKEDFGFVQECLNSNKDSFRIDNSIRSVWNSGVKEAAYIFYDATYLEKYFEDVFQEEYKLYRQVLLIDEKQKDTNNVLLVIKHTDDISEKIDIVNPKYTIIINPSNGVQIEPNLYNKKIKKKQQANISISKQYYESEYFSGTYQELLVAHPEVFVIDDSAEPRKLIITPPTLLPKERTIDLKISSDGKELPIDQKITIKFKDVEFSPWKTVSGNRKIIFSGDEIGKQWIVEVEAGNNYLPKKLHLRLTEDKGFWSIELQKKKEVEHVDGGKNQLGHLYDKRIDSLNQLSNHGENKKKVSKPWWKKTNFLITVVVSVFILSISGFLLSSKLTKGVNTVLSTLGFKEVQKSETAPKLLEIELNLNEIENYCNGMDLNIDTLSQYDFTIKADLPNDSLCIKVSNSIRLRNAINGIVKDSIESVLKINDLSTPQLKLLKLILKMDNFNEFKSISRRDSLSLNSISKILEKKIEKKNTEKDEIKIPQRLNQPVTNPKLENKEALSSNHSQATNSQQIKKEANYTFPIFMKIVSAITTRGDIENKFDKNKLTQNQAELLSKINNNLSRFKSIRNKSGLKPGQLNDSIIKISK